MIGMFKSLGWISYPVTNWPKAKKFYGETLGLPVAAFMGDEVGWMEFGEKKGTHLAIGLWQGPGTFKKAEHGPVAIFAVADAYKAVEALRKKGVKCDDVIAVPKMVTYAAFYDPDGNELQVAGPAPK